MDTTKTYDEGDLLPGRTTVEVVEGVVVKPGQTLIVRVDRTTPADQIHQVRDQLVDQLPGVTVLVIACEQLAVAAAADDDDDDDDDDDAA